MADVEEFRTDSELLSYRFIERALDNISKAPETLLLAFTAEVRRRQATAPRAGYETLLDAAADGLPSLRALLLQKTDLGHELRRLSPFRVAMSAEERRSIIRNVAKIIFRKKPDASADG
jgi:hypothetical protein